MVLIEFRVANHRSIREEQVFTMVAAQLGEESDHRPRKVSGYGVAILPVAAIYGANASGKTNVLDALAFTQLAVVRSHPAWPPEGGVPRSPFAWDDYSNQASTYELLILLDGIRYQYGFVVSDERVLEEWLYAWPKARRQVWFEREWDGHSHVFKFGEGLKGSKRLVEDVTRQNALFLSVAAQHANVQLSPIYEWFRDLRTVGLQRQKDTILHRSGDGWLIQALLKQATSHKAATEEDREIAIFRSLLHDADIGVYDFKLEREQNDEIALCHRAQNGGAWLPLHQESQGTKALFSKVPMLLDALWHGGLVLVDELESSLHPILAQRIVGMFNDPATNSLNAQLIFTTHDTNLIAGINDPAQLRRDQVWLTEKNQKGATKLYPLTDFKPRKAENLERGYLMGRYGAIPFLGRLDTIQLSGNAK